MPNSKTLDFEAVLTAQAEAWPEPKLDAGPLGSGWATAAALSSDTEAVADLMSYQASYTPDLDRKGQAAYAIGEYAYGLAIAAAGPMVGFGVVFDLSPQNCAIGYDVRPIEHRGRTLQERVPRLRLLDAAFVTDDPSLAGATEILDRAALHGRLRGHVEAHFAPLIDRLHEASGLSRNALWRLVGDSFAQRFLDAGNKFGRARDAQADALAVLKKPGSPLANKQLCYFDIPVRDAAAPEKILSTVTYRGRGGCCRFYTVEGGHLCSTCVLQDPVERNVKLERKLRRRLGLPAIA